ncbi:hypothetical protein ACO0LO_19995 [Undibacterium sp. TJN25]|uniref:hypothetical protein n=1 Tax=Undibacterium sp. TJN25 TaxID=3413056 RepID=UPI003BF04955
MQKSSNHPSSLPATMPTYVLKYTRRTVNSLLDLRHSTNLFVDITTAEDSTVKLEGLVRFDHRNPPLEKNIEVAVMTGATVEFFHIEMPLLLPVAVD